MRNVDAFLKKNKDWKYANHLFEEKANKKVANCIRKEIVRKFEKGNGFKFSEQNMQKHFKIIDVEYFFRRWHNNSLISEKIQLGKNALLKL